jgi:hypothetical protein
MKRILLVSWGAILAVACSQSRQTTLAPTPDEVHRYSTVYEGNRIIKYDLNTNKIENERTHHTKVEPVVADAEPAIVERKPIEKTVSTPIASKAKRDFSNFFPFSGRRMSKEAEDDATQSGGWVAEHPGTFAIILYGGAILFFWLPIIGGLLGLAALVFSIIGVVKKTSQTDFILAWVVLGLFILGVLLLLIGAASI